MAPPICSWSFLSSPETAPPGQKSFTQAVFAAVEESFPSLPPKVIVGDTVRIRITQREYEAELSVNEIPEAEIGKYVAKFETLGHHSRLAEVSSSSIFTQWKR